MRREDKRTDEGKVWRRGAVTTIVINRSSIYTHKSTFSAAKKNGSSRDARNSEGEGRKDTSRDLGSDIAGEDPRFFY